MMADYLIVSALCVFSLIVFIAKRNLVDFSLFLFGSFGLSGTAIGIFERSQGYVSLWVGQAIVIVSFFIAMIYILMNRRSSTTSNQLRRWVIPGLIVGVLGALVFARWRAYPFVPDIFAGAGRLAFAEDNDRWVHFASNIVQANDLNLTEGVSGGVAILILIASSFVSVFISLLTGVVNQPAQIIQTVYLSHNLLIVMSPLALSALISSVLLGKVKRKSKIWILDKNLWITVSIALGMVLLILGVSSAVGVGHLTLEFTMVFLAFWASFTIYSRNNVTYLALITLVGSSVAIAWLPLPYISLIIAVTGLLLSFKIKGMSTKKISRLNRILLTVNLLITAWILMPKINFISAAAQPSDDYPIALISAEGGTRSVELFELMLLLTSLVGIVALYYSFGKHRVLYFLSRTYPIFFLLGYSLAIIIFDFLVAPDGWPHYGARKLTFAFVLVCTAVVLPLLVRFLPDASRNLRLASVAVVTALTAAIFSSSTAKYGEIQLRGWIWTLYDQNSVISNNKPQTWVNIANPSQRQNSLEKYPIACILVGEQNEIIADIQSHNCTRFLIGMHGIEPRTWNLFSGIISGGDVSGYPSKEIQYLRSNFGSKPVLVIDGYGVVHETITLSQLLNEVY